MKEIGLVGLTGGIGCGKSTALNIFISLECKVMDADAVCHELYNEADGPVIKAVTERWGSKVISSGNVDRKKIAKIVFTNKNELNWLNQLIHPLIFERTYKACKKTDQVLIFDVPLLFEANWEKYFFKIISVWTTPEIQLERLRARKWSEKEIRSRLESQMSMDIKLEKADFGIINTGSRELLSEQCKNILLEIKKAKEL